MALDAEILVPGNYFCDLIFTGFPSFPSLGTEVYTQGLTVTVGGCLNTVVALARLGVAVGWSGAIGDDFFSQFVLFELRREGISDRWLQQTTAPLQRVTVAVSYPQDRAFITYVDEAPKATDLLIRTLDEGTTFRHLHFSGLTLDARLPALLAQLREKGVTISMDCQHRPETLESPLVRETLAQLDWFMPNASEAQHLTEAHTLDQAITRLIPHTRSIVVKDGANGAWVWHAETRFHAPALSLTPLDTTGAGDVFNAGFLTAILRGESVQVALVWGNTCGGLSTQGHGGARNAPTLAQLNAYLSAMP